MRFFTREWHAGDLSDAKADAVADAYRRHIASVRPALPPGVLELVDGLSLHDARIRRIILDSDVPEIRLELRCGDRITGYEDVALTYTDATLEPTTVEALREATRDSRTEVLYDEIDTAGRQRFTHRLLFWPYREAEITFSALTVERAPAADREFDGADESRWIEN